MPTLAHIAIDLGIAAGMWIAINSLPHWWLCLLASPGIAILLFRNFSLMHEAVHGSASSSRPLNDCVGLYAGMLSLLPYDNWKSIHLSHHKWAGNIDHDPSMSLVRLYPSWPIWARRTLSALWRCWVPALAVLQYVVFWVHSLRLVPREKLTSRRLLSLGMPPLFWTALVLGSPPPVLWAAIVPGIFLYLLAVEVVNFPHHLELPQLHGDTRLSPQRQHQISRTCLYPRWFARYVVLNFNYHVEHHMYPFVPWHALDAIHAETASRLGQDYNTDPHWTWILKNRPRTLDDVLAASSTSSTPPSGTGSHEW
jgi:fatty acid desaturase